MAYFYAFTDSYTENESVYLTVTKVTTKHPFII